jgi:hypothetical protein
MDYSKMTMKELIVLCKETGVKGYSGKKNADLIDLLSKGPPMTSDIYESVLNKALETTSCDVDCLTVKHGSVCIHDELKTLTTNTEKTWAPLKAAVASIVAKLVHPTWDTRKHQAQIGGEFSLRSIDHNHVSSPLFKKGLYDTATEFALTRSFEKAEPYDKSYTGNITPLCCKDSFLKLMEIINTTATTKLLEEMLVYVILFLKERKGKHDALKDSILESSKDLRLSDVAYALEQINKLGAAGQSVVPVIAVHALVTIVQPYLWPSMTVKPLKEHTAPDGHTASYGDVEGFNPSKIPVMAIEVKHKIKVDDIIITTFNKKTATSDIRLKYILTTATIPKYNAQNNVAVQTVTDFITTYLQLTMYHTASICTAFINKLLKCVLSHTNLSLSNKEAIHTILKSLLA